MFKYIKLFPTHSEYETYINGQDTFLPNVSYCIEHNGVHYKEKSKQSAIYYNVHFLDSDGITELNSIIIEEGQNINAYNGYDWYLRGDETQTIVPFPYGPINEETWFIKWEEPTVFHQVTFYDTNGTTILYQQQIEDGQTVDKSGDWYRKHDSSQILVNFPHVVFSDEVFVKWTYDYVDLGLPSGTLWATKNVGASVETDNGLYFQWGDTQGYTSEQVGVDKQFTWYDYKWSINGANNNLEKYGMRKLMKLALEDDAANAHMGGNWVVPSQTQSQELIDNTTMMWAIVNGVKCVIFTSKINRRTITFPMTGNCYEGNVRMVGIQGGCWNNEIIGGSSYLGRGLSITYNNEISADYFMENCVGRAVRGVISINKG